MRAYPFYADFYHNPRWAPNVANGLGATSTQGALAGGSPFQFTYSAGADSVTADGSLLFTTDAVAAALANWAFFPSGTSAAPPVVQEAGNPPQVRVSGYAVTSWPNGQDFANVLVNAIQAAGLPIEGDTAQLSFTPYTPTTTTTTTTTQTQQPQKGFFDSLATSLGVSTGTAQLVVIGGAAFLIFMASGKGKK